MIVVKTIGYHCNNQKAKNTKIKLTSGTSDIMLFTHFIPPKISIINI